MDRVVLTRAQLKKLAEQDKDYVVTAQHVELNMLFIEPLKYEGQGRGIWVESSGKPRDKGDKL